MIFTTNDRREIQARLDAFYEQELKNYEALVASHAPYLMFVAKPERVVFEGTPSQFTGKRGANIRPHYNVRGKR